MLASLCGFLLSGCAGSSEPTTRGELEREFQAEFGFKPPKEVAELRCRIVWVGDTWTKWMLFTLDEGAMQRIIGNGFTLADPASLARPWEKLWTQDLTREKPNPNEPVWWRVPGAKQVRVYHKEGHPRDYSGYRYMWVDGERKVVYAECAAWH